MTSSRAASSLAGHLRILRLDHWIKNVFVLPGLVVGLTVRPEKAVPEFLPVVMLGFVAIGLVTSSNYVLNELLDASFDREHPVKRARPVPSGAVSVPIAWMQWLALMLAGVGLGLLVSVPFAATLGLLWAMGCVYNVAPVRTKDIPYVDVLSEAANNPLRMLAGWFLVGLPAARIPISLLISYWTIGAYFMAIKRFAELREIGDPVRAARYRRSFAFYSEPRLLISIVFYASAAMLFWERSSCATGWS